MSKLTNVVSNESESGNWANSVSIQQEGRDSIWGSAITWSNDDESNLTVSIYNYHSKEELFEHLDEVVAKLKANYKEQH